MAKDHPRLGSYVILSLTAGIRTEEARALEKSRRTLALPQNAVAALREHRQWQMEARLAADSEGQEAGPERAR